MKCSSDVSLFFFLVFSCFQWLFVFSSFFHFSAPTYERWIDGCLRADKYTVGVAAGSIYVSGAVTSADDRWIYGQCKEWNSFPRVSREGAMRYCLLLLCAGGDANGKPTLTICSQCIQYCLGNIIIIILPQMKVLWGKNKVCRRRRRGKHTTHTHLWSSHGRWQTLWDFS